MAILTQSNPTFDKLDIIMKSSITVTKNANETIGLGIFNHNLGYKPIVLPYNQDQQAPLPVIVLSQSGADAGKISTLVNINSIGTESIVFSVITPDHSSSYNDALEYTIEFYLLRERAQ